MTPILIYIEIKHYDGKEVVKQERKLISFATIERALQRFRERCIWYQDYIDLDFFTLTKEWAFGENSEKQTQLMARIEKDPERIETLLETLNIPMGKLKTA